MTIFHDVPVTGFSGNELDRADEIRRDPAALIAMRARPDARWLVVGWGSAAFYTTAGTYADIAPSAVWTAATGDAAVRENLGGGGFSAADPARPVHLWLPRPPCDQGVLRQRWSLLQEHQGALRQECLPGRHAGDAHVERIRHAHRV